uniref:Uncharacterized protein n=1 Tax=Anguilla anguilla TaxID=7936 RepID=A0A0E9TV69_ANGAN
MFSLCGLHLSQHVPEKGLLFLSCSILYLFIIIVIIKSKFFCFKILLLPDMSQY